MPLSNPKGAAILDFGPKLLWRSEKISADVRGQRIALTDRAKIIKFPSSDFEGGPK